MSVEKQISLTDEDYAYASSLVARGVYASISAVLQDGISLLRQGTEAGADPAAKLQELIDLRRAGPFVPLEDMDDFMSAVARKDLHAT